jgi:PIN domain nuclease of toxin-antitoxin system
LIHIDTHVAIWLAERRLTALSATAQRLIDREELQISPMVGMELETLHEVGKLRNEPDRILAVLERDHGVTRSQTTFDEVIAAARTFAWTREPFDRLIVANALADRARLLTADALILRRFQDAVW